MTSIDIVNQYIQENTGKVNQKYKHKYHSAVPIGWMNDPNGFSYYKGEYHLFYQYYPFDSKWGPMHWGHFITADLIKWETLPIALAPDMDYEKSLGCFSGTGFVENNKLYLIYTGALETEDKLVKQQQCLAETTDGINFIKHADNPIILTEQIPEGFSKTDFRDPKLFQRNGLYYCLIGGRRDEVSISSEGGNILLYESDDLIHWNYIGTLFNQTITKDGVLECPDIFQLEGKDVLICSPQNLPYEDYKYQNTASTVYFIGNLDLKTGEFISELMDEIDAGFDFYAPQTVVTPDGRIVMTAWMNMWGRSYPTAKDGWVGANILPRELTLEEGCLRQNPVKEIENYRTNLVSYHDCIIQDNECISFDGVFGQTIELLLSIDLLDSDVFGLKLFAGERHETLLYYERKSNLIVFDRSNSGESVEISPSERHFGDGIRKVKINVSDNVLTFRIFLDSCSMEAFFQNGERVLTSTIFPDENDNEVYFFALGGKALIKSLTKYEIK